ncbi:MAG: cation-translocating P-type ATPase C-terminal domain-containing protein [Acidimicrobiia bacterium]|nr:cation-translocating P-type ATPase C-terminal domain-containing protein [Acidimicrobiia bacterium]
MQLLFCKFFVVVAVVVGFIADVPDPSVMQRPPRSPGSKIANAPQAVRWAIAGLIVAGTALAMLELGAGRAQHHRRVDLDDHGVRGRRVQRCELRARLAART